MDARNERRHLQVGRDHLTIEPDRLVIRSPVDMLDWQVREFRCIRIDHEDRSWELVAKVPGVRDTVRYELAPWPADRQDLPGAVVRYDEDYVSARDEARRRQRRAEAAGFGGFLTLPLLGLLPARVKLRLEEEGSPSAIAATAASRALVWTATLLSGSMGLVLMVGGSMAGSAALAGLGLSGCLAFLPLGLDCVARRSRYLDDSMDVSGFWEWAWTRRTSASTASPHHVDGPGRVWIVGDEPRREEDAARRSEER